MCRADNVFSAYEKTVPKLLMTSFVSLLARPIATVASLTTLNLSASVIKQHTVTQFNNLIVQSLCFEHDFVDYFHIKY
jgi:hypothetical protein